MASLSATKGLIMAVRRTKRTGFIHPRRELEKLGPARDMLIAVCTNYPIHSDPYRRASEAKDAVAEALVGDRTFFSTNA